MVALHEVIEQAKTKADRIGIGFALGGMGQALTGKGMKERSVVVQVLCILIEMWFTVAVHTFQNSESGPQRRTQFYYRQILPQNFDFIIFLMFVILRERA